MKPSYELSDQALLRQIGERIKQERLRRDWGAEFLAQRCAISRNTLGNIEAGRSSNTLNLLAVLRELRLLDVMFSLAEPAPESPMALAAKQGSVARKRASGTRTRKPTARVKKPARGEAEW
ncbi:helix-turn-helix domain-containing protein [Simiduia agarivorans]|uniref:XRE family transcriptional regulator n=1 Tax=Simiduia agarivorans (strain DSM 21679 / JCM 13881 / BCRC 17597 / SA1) TaxID=1117647 RepID=K4KH41_SIMAS|nr:helix-turn-helix transcriptional regulator [Simiduia agarivorans]AFU97525.1 XRE family transcriptional regulator [Simiduia agarivorans SA1 = DSM 21679]